MSFLLNFFDQNVAPWLQHMVASNAPALPLRWVMQVHLALGWSVVLACLGVWVVKRHKQQIYTAAALALWALVPGPWSPTYWLGLAFQAPSVLSVLLCGVLLHRTLTQRVMTDAVVRSSRHSLFAFAIMGTVLGWVLLLDTFAVLPVQLYAWGFSPAAVAFVALATLLPWAISLRGPLDPLAWTAPLAVALFVLLRLPTGNVWDAVLDPWLWLVLQWVVVRRVFLVS